MFGLENNSILINLAVSLLIALMTLLYFRQQLTTIDHKVNSMFSLLTSMTNELNHLSRLNLTQNGDDIVNESSYDNDNDGSAITSHQREDARINVSDESSDDESGSYDDDESESDDDDELSTTPLSEIQTLNMGSELHDIKVIEMGAESESDAESDAESNIDSGVDSDSELLASLNEKSIIEDSNYDINSINQIEFDNLVEDLIEQTSELNSDELEPMELLLEQPVNITTLASEPQSVKTVDVVVDYSKMSVKALKDIVSSKNLASNVNKMKKQELIQLLSV